MSSNFTSQGFSVTAGSRLLANPNRGNAFMVVNTGAADVQIGLHSSSNSDMITLVAHGGHYAPNIGFTGDLYFGTVGTVVVVSGAEEVLD